MKAGGEEEENDDVQCLVSMETNSVSFLQPSWWRRNICQTDTAPPPDQSQPHRRSSCCFDLIVLLFWKVKHTFLTNNLPD